MKALIIYDSLYGNTKKVAETIKKGLLSEVKDSKQYQVKVEIAKDADPKSINELELLIVGSPTHGGWYTEDVKAFLEALPQKLPDKLKTATFDTSTPIKDQGFFVNTLTKLFGRAAPRIDKALKKHSAKVLATESFIVLGKEGPLQKGELVRAEEWAKSLLKK